MKSRRAFPLLTLGFAMLSHPVALAQQAGPPTKLKFYEGGHFGPSSWLKLEAPGPLIYEYRSETGAAGSEKLTIDPAKWALFRTALDAAKVWDWKEDYTDPGAFDGTQWALELEYADRRISVHGSNAWPDGEQYQQMRTAMDALSGIDLSGEGLTPAFYQLNPGEGRVAVQGNTPTTRAPHGLGNVYAPEIRLRRGREMMWFGGQGQDGHDRIHLAVSKDGLTWEQKGVVLEDPTANSRQRPHRRRERRHALHVLHPRG